MADEIEVARLHVIEFDYRSDDGERIVGPFTSREGAEQYVTDLMSDDFRAEYEIYALGAVEDEDVELDEDEMVPDEPEEGEELITEIPVHGVATVEGTPTGDGRGFRPGSLSFASLPQPLGFEFESGHGSDNSRVAIVGRIDTFEVVGSEARWTGVIFPHKDYANQAIDGIVDGSYTGVSVIVDTVTEDVTEEREKLLAQLQNEAGEKSFDEMTPQELEEFVDQVIGDGTRPTVWYSKAQIRRFDMVPTGAFVQGYVALGHEFPEELTPEQIEASVNALTDCGCGKVASLTASAGTMIIDLTEFSEEELAEYDALDPEAQEVYAREHNAILAAGFAPGTKDGPGWITHPIPTARIRRYWVRGKGALKIKWGVPGDFNRCRMQLAKYVQNPDWLAGLCANMHKEAIGVWPGQEGGGRHSILASAAAAPLFSLVAAAAPTDARYFQNPRLDEPTGFTVDENDEDHIYGHIAAWNICHIGMPEGPNTCTMAPHSATDYAHFMTGTILTTEGRMSVGSITMGTGHAGERSNSNAAIAHYDNTGAVVADIVVGEDKWGIWFSGRFRETATEQQRYELAASGRLSGDWRLIGGNYELVAALAVNVPGFPIPKLSLVASADLGLVAITAAGIVDFGEEGTTTDQKVEPLVFNSETVAGIAIAAVETYIMHEKRAALVEQLSPAREAFRQLELATARRALETMGA